ncbi:MAG: Mut7-C RNAse domain-containing protein [PVC group bacterium]
MKERRIILTRDRRLLKNSLVTHGCWISSQEPTDQARAALERFDLFSQIKPFKRCLAYNGEIKEVAKEKIIDCLPPKMKIAYDDFRICSGCGKISWRGSLYRAIMGVIDRLKDHHKREGLSG